MNGRDTLHSGRRVGEQIEAKPHVDRTEQLVLEPEVHLRTIVQLEKPPKLRCDALFVGGAVSLERIVDKSRAVFEKFVQIRTAEIAFNETLAANERLAPHAAFPKLFHLCVARQKMKFHIRSIMS